MVAKLGAHRLRHLPFFHRKGCFFKRQHHIKNRKITYVAAVALAWRLIALCRHVAGRRVFRNLGGNLVEIFAAGNTAANLHNLVVGSQSIFGCGVFVDPHQNMTYAHIFQLAAVGLLKQIGIYFFIHKIRLGKLVAVAFQFVFERCRRVKSQGFSFFYFQLEIDEEFEILFEGFLVEHLAIHIIFLVNR